MYAFTRRLSILTGGWPSTVLGGGPLNWPGCPIVRITHTCSRLAFEIQSWKYQQVATEDIGKEQSCKTARGGRFQTSGEATAVDYFRCRQHDEFSWTSLISEYTKCGDGRQALKVYEQMRQSGIKPSSHAFVVTLKACNSLKDLECAKLIHNHIMESGCELDVYVGTMLVDVYAKCGSLVDAACVFHKMPNRNVVSWNAMILGYAQMQEGEKALQLYALMQRQGLIPNNRTFVAVLKACSSLVALAKGTDAQGILVRERCLKQVRTIHSQLLKNGSGSDIFVDTMLVDIYAKCGSLVDARRIFDIMPRRNVVSWTAMILGYAQMRESSEALQLYARMQQENVEPNLQTFVAVLKACSSLAALGDGNEANRIRVKTKCLEQVRAIHAKVSTLNVFVGNILMDVYAKSGSLLEAKCVFEKMPHRNVVSWNTMILGYAHMGEGIDALVLYEEMQQDGVLPDERTFVAALKACSTLAAVGEENQTDCESAKKLCLEHVRTIRLQIEKQGCQANVFVCNMLVDVFAKCRNLLDARLIFEKIQHHSVVSWNAMILGYAQMGQGEEALLLYRRMQQEGMPPDDRTFVAALKACISLAALQVWNQVDGRCVKKRSLEQLRAIHLDAVKKGSEKALFVGNLLVDAYAKCGSLVDARRVFQRMPHRDVVSWNALILGHAQMGEGKQALQFYAQMQQEGVEPDNRTFVSALKACSMASWEDDDNDARCGRKECLKQVRAIHSDVLMRSELAIFVGTVLVDMYAKCGSLVDARCVFENMPDRNVACWNAMILGHVQMEGGEEALQLFEQMQQEGVAPDNQTFVGALKACGLVAGLQKGKDVHAQICSRELEGTCLFISSALIDMYGKCGSMVDAQHVFDKVPRKDIVSWSALIAGYARHGDSEAVFYLFHTMTEEDKVYPNSITFQSILTVCSHAGLVDKGQKYFKAMIRDYSISPTIGHYTCMVDLLGRAGHLDKAMEVVRTMPFQPDGVVWETVLGACLKWNHVQEGRDAFECAVRLDGMDAGAYILMANIYAAANMSENVNEIEAMRRRAAAWKPPGQSWWIGVNGIVHVFMVGDENHPESPELHARLQDLVIKMKRENM